MSDMSDNLFAAVDARTRLAGSNCMEILLFSLGTRETFGINVFKVREVSTTPKITRAPNMPPGVEGLISLRGHVIPVLSLTKVMGLGVADAGAEESMLVAEFSKRTLGFLVREVDRIIRVDWEAVRSPEGALGGGQGFITAITDLPDGRLVSILDVESILAKTFGEPPVKEVERDENCTDSKVFFVDDSAVARRKIAEVLDRIGVHHRHALNGREAWNRLLVMANHAEQCGHKVCEDIDCILLDAEMPEMDGYVLTRHIRDDARFEGIPIVMHSSLSSQANRAMGRSVGVDAYVAKFDARGLADTLRPYIAKHRQ
ncbi:MAG: chemotaxis protein CheV [Betaproteobacteria bacterium]|nr:chemotaxis protein CheV [Betaproteobacteria bacterium]